MIEHIQDVFVNWDKHKVIKNSLCNGKKYATYRDMDCTVFNFWLSRKQIKELSNNKLTGV